MSIKLIADSGATKCEWCLLQNGKKKTILTQGISPYFLNSQQIITLLQKELLPKLKGIKVDELYFYGTGLSNPNNSKIIKLSLKKLFTSAKVEVNTDLLAAARALCGSGKGIACILGTGSNSCYYNGKKIVKNSPGLGYILGDEGSGAFLGKKVIQHYLYHTFDEDLMSRFDAKFTTNTVEILERVYKEPLANRYLATFAVFLAENRGHYMIENIIEDGLNDETIKSFIVAVPVTPNVATVNEDTGFVIILEISKVFGDDDELITTVFPICINSSPSPVN